MTYYEKLPLIKSHDPLNAWPSEVAWQIKNIHYHNVMATKPGMVVTCNEELPSIKSQGPLKAKCCLPSSRDKLNILYLYYHKSYSHQTWKGGDLLWRFPTHKVTQPFEIMWQVKNIFFPLPQSMNSPELAAGWPRLRGSQP